MKRFFFLILRVFHAAVLSVKGFFFAIRFRNGNRFFDLFRLRKAMELQYISPLHRWKGKKEKDFIRFSAGIFGYRGINLDLHDSFQMAISREFLMENLYDLSALPFRPSIILDCGAYQGYFTLKAVYAFPEARILCYEPHPGNAAVLRELFAPELANGKVDVVNSALSANAGFMPMEIWGSNTRQTDDSASVPQMITVSTVSFRDVLYSLNPDESLLIKMDIEGSEKELFPGSLSLLPKKCAVFLETHHGNDYLRQVKEAFLNHGFRFVILKSRGVDADIYAVRS